MKKHMIKRLTCITLLLLCMLHAKAEVVGDSIDTFQNQTVSTTLNLQGRKTVTMNDVIVTSTGHLTVSAPRGVMIPANLEVQLGGTLELIGQLTNFIRFNYDESGNRIRRQHSVEFPE